jgi:hypothetical protein
MGVIAGANINDNGLIFSLDAANFRSYSGSGLTSFGLVGGIGGTLVNGVGFTSSYGGSFYFDGTNDFINAAGFAISTNLNEGFTWGGWCKHDNINGGWSWVLSCTNGNNAQPYIWFQLGKMTGDGNIRFESGSFNSNGALDATTNIADGKMHYLLGLWDKTNGKKQVYIDGVLISTTNVTTGTIVDFGTLLIGCQCLQNVTYREFWIGNISQIHIYNRALTAQEIKQNYNATKKRYGL